MRLLMLCCLLAGGLNLTAQNLQFGIGLSGGLADIHLAQPNRVIALEGFNEGERDGQPKAGIGFSINVYSRILLNDWLAVSSAPSILFQNTRIEQLDQNGSPLDYDLYPANIALPVALEVSPGKGQWRPNFSAGLGVLIDLANDELPENTLRSNLLFGQLSAGISREFSKFIFRPELVYWGNIVRLNDGVLSGDPAINPASRWNYLGLRLLFYGNR
ncbi:MAG: hypothetical protein AAF433_04745 [Bacteroidota bacterium]